MFTDALRSAEKVVIVPGSGLVVAQADAIVAEIALRLRQQVCLCTKHIYDHCSIYMLRIRYYSY